MKAPHASPTPPSLHPEGIISARGRDYQTPSEQALDKAIERYDFHAAQVIINRLLDDTEGIGHLAASKAFNIALKEIALPMYYRAAVEMNGETYEDAESDISSMYAYATNLMGYIQNEISEIKALPTKTREDRETLALCRGALTEVTVFALMSRCLYGDNDDQYTIVPASRREDRGAIINGLNSGIDFKVIDRETQAIVSLQVKTSTHGVHMSRYQQGIAMVSLEHLAHPYKIPELQDSLIADVEGISSDQQTAIIEQASGKLLAKLERRFNRNVKPSAMPTSLLTEHVATA
jgi:hypothetical protein